MLCFLSSLPSSRCNSVSRSQAANNLERTEREGAFEVAQRLECAAFPRFLTATHRQVVPPAHRKRRNTPHSRRFARFGCGLAALLCAVFALAQTKPLYENNFEKAEV